MGCVQSKSAQNPTAEVLPTSVKVANSTKTGVAPGNPTQATHTGDPIYLDRADTWATETPLDNSTGFQIKSEGMAGRSFCNHLFVVCYKQLAVRAAHGTAYFHARSLLFSGNEGLREYVADVKASNRPKDQREKGDASGAALSTSAAPDMANTVSDRGSFDANNSPVSPPQGDSELVVAESLPSELSIAQAQAQRASRTSWDGATRGGKVSLPPLPPGVIPRKRAASASGVSVSVLDRLESETLPPKATHQISLPGSTGAPTTEPLPLAPSTSGAALEAAANGPAQSFKQMNAGKPKGFAKRAQFGSMYMPAAHSSINRPTYAQDAVDEDNADAKMSGIFSVYVSSRICSMHIPPAACVVKYGDEPITMHVCCQTAYKQCKCTTQKCPCKIVQCMAGVPTCLLRGSPCLPLLC